MTRKFSPRKSVESEDWSIEIVRWHNLGQCRSPHDLEWYNLKTMSSEASRRREDMCGPGMVHRVWTEAEFQERERGIPTKQKARCQARRTLNCLKG